MTADPPQRLVGPSRRTRLSVMLTVVVTGAR